VGEFTKPSGNYVVYDKFIHKLQGLYKGKEASWAVEASGKTAKEFLLHQVGIVNNVAYHNSRENVPTK